MPQYVVLLEIADTAGGDAAFSATLSSSLTRAALLVDGVTSASVQQLGTELLPPTEP